MPSKKGDVEKEGFPSLTLITEERWLTPVDSTRTRMRVHSIGKEEWRQKMEELRSGEEGIEGTFVIMLPSSMSDEEMEEIREEAKKTVESNEGLTLFLVPSFVRERSSQFSIECHRRVATKMNGKWRTFRRMRNRRDYAMGQKERGSSTEFPLD